MLAAERGTGGTARHHVGGEHDACLVNNFVRNHVFEEVAPMAVSEHDLRMSGIG